MCLQIDIFDSEAADYDHLLFRRGLISRLAASGASSSSESNPPLVDHQISSHLQKIDLVDIPEILIKLDDDTCSSYDPLNEKSNGDYIKHLWGNTKKQVQVLGQKIEQVIKYELLLTLVSIAGQNAVQMAPSLSSSSSPSCRRAAAVSSWTAFILLLSGVAMRSSSGARSGGVGILLVLLGVLFTVGVPLFNLCL